MTFGMVQDVFNVERSEAVFSDVLDVAFRIVGQIPNGIDQRHA